jgi:small subunit ribosomal protein S6
LAQNVYECLAILDSNKYAQDPNGLGSAVPNLIEKFGGEVLISRMWQEQKLAYPVDGHKKGTYWLTYFRLESTKLIEMKREMKLNDHIVRELTIKLDPRIVDALVDHARGVRRAEPAAEAVREPVGAGVGVEGEE